MTLNKKQSEEWLFVPLLRQAVGDQVVYWAPVITNLSQIQPGMTSKLTCSSFHTLSNSSAQWAENQYRDTLKIAHTTDCPFNYITTDTMRERERFNKLDKCLVPVLQQNRSNTKKTYVACNKI